METIREGAFAKLNLTLDVLGKREDGFHDLKSIMQTISLHDDVMIDVDTGNGWQVHCFREILPEAPENAEEPPESEFITDGLPQNEANIAWKAARIFFDRIKKEPNGIEIFINKRIPSEAGMGGGSADAAAVLRGLNRHYGYPLSLPALAELGAEVGSDVPFCVYGGTAMVEGRGERVNPVSCDMELYYVVCKPEFGVSTPELYRKIDTTPITRRPDHNSLLSNFGRKDYLGVGGSLCNVFEPLVMDEHFDINYIKSVMFTYGAYGAQMTGSGSAVFGVFDSFEYATVACMMLKDKYSQIFLTKNV